MEAGRDIEVFGELGLLKAVLQFAIIDVYALNEKVRDKAREWLFDDEPPTSCKLTFLYICEALDLCPHTVRRNVLRLSETPVALRKSHFKHETAVRKIYDPNPKGLPPMAVNYYGWK